MAKLHVSASIGQHQVFHPEVLYGVRVFIYKHSYPYKIYIYINTLTHTNLSDEKPDDGQCWPKHVVLSFSSKTSTRCTLLCYGTQKFLHSMRASIPRVQFALNLFMHGIYCVVILSCILFMRTWTYTFF